MIDDGRRDAPIAVWNHPSNRVRGLGVKYIDDGEDRGLWLPVDPTLNEFPADATHLRLARGGLDKQAAILPLIGRLKMTILDMKLAENTTPVLVGAPSDLLPIQQPTTQQQTSECCWLNRWLRPRSPNAMGRTR